MASPAAYVQYYKAAAQRYGIPPSTLAGLVTIESGGNPTARSPVGAQGLTQFMPGTAKSYGVQFGSSPAAIQSQVLGAARYLSDLGYAKNPRLALSSYNAGPGNPGAAGPYAANVLAAAKKYAYLDRGGGTSPLPQIVQGGNQILGPAPQTSSQTVPTFNQAGFQKANRAFIVGNFLSHQQGPYDTGGSGSNPLFTSGLASTTAPNPQDFQGTKTIHQTVHFATGELQKMAGTSLVNTHPGAKGYVNPIPGAVIGRTDMGVDANLKPGAPIRAIGDSRVMGISPNWYKGQPYVLLQLLSGPQKGKFYYVAEQIAPSVRAGQTVRAGQPIGTYAQSGTGIEIGWGSPQAGRTLAQATSGYSEGQVTPAGSSFRNFLGSL